MQTLLILFLFITLVYAAPGYFDILDDEFEQELNGVERTFYIAAEESIWDYASQSPKHTSIPGTKQNT